MTGVVPLPHTPVLLREVIEALTPREGGRFIDGTLGAGGHAAEILEASTPGGRLLGLDADNEAIATARKTLERFGDRAVLVNANFRDLEKIATAHGFVPADGVLLDLGLSSMQLSTSARGFSFQSSSLDMRMNQTEGTTAQELVNELSERELADLIYKYGEEKRSRQIARHIVRARPLHTGEELAQVVERGVARRGRVHPATRTFQALRIAVNHEMENLDRALPQLTRVTRAGSRAAIITFHSLEDRRVKDFFRRNADWQNLTKHPVKPGRTEILANPRSRSAKLRVAERL